MDPKLRTKEHFAKKVHEYQTTQRCRTQPQRFKRALTVQSHQPPKGSAVAGNTHRPRNPVDQFRSGHRFRYI